MFNNFSLSNEEISKIIKDYKNLIHKYSYVNDRYNEDLEQEIRFKIFRVLSKNRKK